MIVALDIETRSLTEDKDDALIPHLSEITCVGMWHPTFSRVFRDKFELLLFLTQNPELVFVGQNLKFDLRHLAHKGIKIPMARWADDTQLMAAISLEKIPDGWLADYEEKRKEENKKLKKGYSHRKAGKHSLKTLAPYFLKVKPFWENPENHDDDTYVLKDCEYTWRLRNVFYESMYREGTLNFYKDKLLPWTKMILQAEIKGISLDMPALQSYQKEIGDSLKGIEEALDREFTPAYEAYQLKQIDDLKAHYNKKKIEAIGKLKSPTEVKISNVHERYSKLLNKALDGVTQKCNLASPTQLLWILKDFYGLDCRDFNGDEGTGIEVLEKLNNGNPQIKALIQHREVNKLHTAFFPTYLKLQAQGTLHPNFHTDGTRTGRLSCSEPNLQQVPSGLHKLFVARPGHKLITKDMSAIEPHLIAYYTNDPELYSKVKEFHANNVRVFFKREGSKKDIKENHPLEYSLAKEVGLACLYGAGARRIEQSAQKYGIKWTQTYCRELKSNLKKAYPKAFEFKEELDKKAACGPYMNLFGRMISFRDNPEDIYMKAFNTLIQSSASDLLLNSSLKIEEEFLRLEIKGKILLWIHDEIVVEVPEDKVELANKVIDRSLTTYDLPTPFGPVKLEVEGKISSSWEK